MRGPMNIMHKTTAAAMLAAALAISCAGAGTQAAQAQTRRATRREKTPPQPSVEQQIQELRQELQSQIDELKQELATKDQQLQQAQQAAAAAQAAADKAQSSASEQQQAVTENTSAVSALQSSVNGLRSSSSSMSSSLTTISKNTAEIKKAVEKPDALHFKGITISPTGSFIEAATVWRQGAMADGLNTHFSAVPLDHSDNAQISEFQGSGRQSRIALKAVGDVGPFAMTGYYEMDWLSAGTTSNNNQSNSYTVRQRQLWADASLKDGWDFSGGQGWSLATETTNLLHRGSEILPDSIDPQYMAGFVWTRQYSFRVAKDFNKKFAFGVSAENAEMLDPAGANLPTNLFYGAAGDGGGLYDNQAHYSFNATPDFIAKIAVQPGWGHWEMFGIGRSFRDRLYPVGGTPSNNTVWGGGVGGGFRGPLADKHLVVGLKGLWGQGMGRYGSSTIADVTLRPDGTLSPLHSFSGISTVQFIPNPRLMVYLNYGADYVGRDWTLNNSGQEVGYGTYTSDMSGCDTEPAPGGPLNPNAPSNCKGNTKDVGEFSAGWWYQIYKGEKGNLRYGIQYARFERDLWSGAGGTTNPGGGAKGVDNMWWSSFRYYLP
jgi:Skp family chaperone for outer membrane proteins